jgi:hypothetical protein
MTPGQKAAATKKANKEKAVQARILTNAKTKSDNKAKRLSAKQLADRQL